MFSWGGFPAHVWIHRSDRWFVLWEYNSIALTVIPRYTELCSDDKTNALILYPIHSKILQCEIRLLEVYF